MKRVILISCFMVAFFIRYESVSQTNPVKSMSTFKVRHTVVFSLRYPKGSAEEKTFLEAARKLSSIPGVLNFECLREVSSKNNYDFGLSMEFESLKAYEAYQKYPDHDVFVKTYWMRDVKDFLEIDYELLK